MSQETCRGLPNVVRFRREICGDLVQAERREWCLANGLGAYAAGTLAGSLTRRYHGLLVAPCEPPLGRRLILAKADATLVDGDLEYPLFTNRWADGILAPAGHMHIEAFRQSVRDEKCDDPRCVTMVAAAHDRGRPCAVAGDRLQRRREGRLDPPFAGGLDEDMHSDLEIRRIDAPYSTCPPGGHCCEFDPLLPGYTKRTRGRLLVPAAADEKRTHNRRGNYDQESKLIHVSRSPRKLIFEEIRNRIIPPNRRIGQCFRLFPHTLRLVRSLFLACSGHSPCRAVWSRPVPMFVVYQILVDAVPCTPWERPTESSATNAVAVSKRARVAVSSFMCSTAIPAARKRSSRSTSSARRVCAT
jgi:hypothetical protein